MDQLKQLVGVEHGLEGVCNAIHMSVVGRIPSVVGAMHITCADESEHECVTAFQKGFVNLLLPQLKFAQQSAFRIANLGGRYDWGGVRIAEDHYAAAESVPVKKVLVVKVNSHVGVLEEHGTQTFGVMQRYQDTSHSCGALNALLSGDKRPFALRLAELFVSEGPDRLAMLRDEKQVDPALRPLYAALVSARLQARKVILDIQDYEPVSPTEFLVIPCVTLNRKEKDTEIVCGFYFASEETGLKEPEYYGLGDNPAAFSNELKHNRIVITDDQLGSKRIARDHRALALAQWHEMTRDRRVTLKDKRLDEVKVRTAKFTGPRVEKTKLVLPVLLTVLAEVEPISAATLLFGHGLAGIHHAFQVHRMARQIEGSEYARRILLEIREKVDTLEPKQAEAMVDLLAREYRL
ncbi:MAG: hypothetical protein JSW51_03005 [Gemmatimonadota bacterium]|nr:MAG: hypothetical protein JSW51_03005 [Gemmatimonadota bacterium]